MTHIVVGVDGSPSAAAALTWAATEAARTDADLVVVHAWMPGRAPAVARDLRGTRSAIRQTVVDWTLGVLGPDSREPRVRVEARIGRPVSVLLTAARQADALVLGHDDTASAPQRFTARRCLAAARVPVIVVRTSDGTADRHLAASLSPAR